ncbi:MAG TPA: PAS domain S-box protein [Dehalococcoidia bacterium]|nr:PAS domain S-box protein [Dehalococcoidia bacterium]
MLARLSAALEGEGCAEAGGNHALSLMEPAELLQVRKAFRQAQRGQSCGPIVVRIPKRTGDCAQFELHLFRAEANSSPSGVYALAYPATETAKKQRQLETYAAKFSALARTSHIGIFVFQESRFLYVNRAGREITGYNKKELANLSFWDLLLDEDRERFRRLAQERLSSNKRPSRGEARIIRKNGGLRWVDYTVTSVDLDSGPVIMATALDITEFKQSTEREKRLIAILESTTDFVSFADEKGRLLYLNRAGREMLGMGHDEDISELQIFDLVPAKERAAQRRRLSHTVRTGANQAETHFLRRDGSTIPVSLVALAHRKLDGSIDFLSAIARDISESKQAEEMLRQSEERLRDLFEGTFEGITVHDNGHILDCNSNFARMFGYSREEIIGSHVITYVAPESRELVLERIKTGDERPYECLALRKDGSKFEVEALGKQHVYLGRPVRVSAVRDISERKRLERELRASEENFRLMVEHVKDYALIMLDAQGCIMTWNPGAERMSGYQEKEVVGRHVSMFYPKEVVEAGRMEEELRQAQRQGHAGSEGWRVRKDGSRFWGYTVTTTLYDSEGQLIGFARLTQDLTARRQNEELIRHMAQHDSLTGLPNQTVFYERLNQTIAEARRGRSKFAVMYIDLDRFKLINDAFGYSVGDEFLKSASQALSEALRESDVLARIGGGEFTAILKPIRAAEEAGETARRIQESLRHLPPVEGQQFTTTASIGISLYPDDGTEAETLLRNADLAMYQAKDMGRNMYRLYSSSVHPTILKNMTLENDLRSALRRNELRLHYQPQVNVASGQIIGVEALVRWAHPERGLLPPDAFIPLAEVAGLIQDIDEWVLREASRQNRKWQLEGLPSLRVAVNISAARFRQPELTAKIQDILRETGFDPQWLRLEITEDVAIRDMEATVETLNGLRKLGIEIALDDFGKGHSSLNYLRRLPIDQIKIDGSFVRDISAAPNDILILSTMIALARSLNLEIIAEGVETEEQALFLRERECFQMQGYFFAKPMTPAAFAKLLQNESSHLSKRLFRLRGS